MRPRGLDTYRKEEEKPLNPLVESYLMKKYNLGVAAPGAASAGMPAAAAAMNSESEEPEEQPQYDPMKEFRDASATTGVDAARADADSDRKIANMGQALEGLVRSVSMSRGGQGVNSGVYDSLRSGADKRVAEAESARRNSMENVMQTNALRRQGVSDTRDTERFGREKTGWERDDALFQQGQKKNERETKKWEERNDPNSPLSGVVRDQYKGIFAKLDPALQARVDWNSMSAQDIEDFMKQPAQFLSSAQERRDARRANAATVAATREQTNALRASAAAEKREEKLDKKTNAYSQELEKTGIPSAQAAIDAVNKLLPKTGDVPGYGNVAGALPDFMVSQGGEDLRQSVQTLFNVELKNRSGAAVTDQELQRLRKEFGQGTWKSDDQLRKGIAAYAARMQEVITNIQAGTSPDARTEYVNRGGRDFSSSMSPKNKDRAGHILLGSADELPD